MTSTVTTVLPQDVTPKTAEWIFREAKRLAERPYPATSAVAAAYRILDAREPKFMLCLEKCAAVLDRMAEDQHGRTKRDRATEDAYRYDPAVASAFREAFRAAQDGKKAPEWGYLYAAAAKFAGFIVE